MNRLNKILFVFQILVGVVWSAHAQDTPGALVLRNAPDGSVELKWVGDRIFTKEDVNVYRKDAGSGEDAWQRLNDIPLGLNEELGQEAVDLFNDILTAPDGFAMSMLIIQTLDEFFQNNEAALNAGIYFKDSTAVLGQSYDFKVQTIGNGNSETLFAQTDGPFLVKAYEPLALPDSIITSGDKNAYRIGWRPETSRYLGVNVYASFLEAGDYEKAHESLLFPSQDPFAESMDTSDFTVYHFMQPDQQAGETKYFKLRNYGFFQDSSELSESYPITILASEPPPEVDSIAITAVDPENRLIELSWMHSAENTIYEDLPVSFQLYRSHSKGDFEKVGDPFPYSQDIYTYIDEFPRYGIITYHVRTIGLTGLEAASKNVEVEVPDKYPPSAPTNVKAVATEGAITVTWDPSPEPDVMGYYLYGIESSMQDKSYIEITPGMLTETIFVDSFPREAKNEFAYKVMAVDSSLNEGPHSELAFAKLPDVIPPPAPVILDITREEEAVQINWIPSFCDDLRIYELYRAPQSDTSTWSMIASSEIGLNDTTYLDQSITLGERYYYKMQSEDIDGNRSIASNVYPVITKAPDPEGIPPTNFSASYQKKNKKVELDWDLPADANPLGVIVYRQENGASFFPYSPMLQDSQFEDEDAEPGNTYGYQVRVFYEKGVKAQSEIQTIEIEAENE